MVSDRRTAFEKEKVIEEQKRKYEEERKLVEKEIRDLKEALKQEQAASEAIRSQLAHKELDLDEMVGSFQFLFEDKICILDGSDKKLVELIVLLNNGVEFGYSKG